MTARPCFPFAALCVACLAVLAPAPARATYHALEAIPVESPVYRMAEDLAASYGLGSAFLATRPWDRADLGRFLDELVAADSAAARDPLLVRLRRELDPSDAVGGWEPAWAKDDDAGSLELSAYARGDYAEDRARHAIVRDLRAGATASLALGENVLLWTDVYAGTTSPGAHGNPANSVRFGLIEGVQLNSYFDRSYVTWRGRYGRVHVGHDWLRWGSGTWGTMALSDGAPAFDLAEARVPVLSFAQLDWFVATLDPTQQSYLAGHKLEVRATDNVSLSFAELARFTGSSTAGLYLVPLIPYAHAEKRVLKASGVPGDTIPVNGQNNVMWAGDVTWRWRPGVRFHGELAVDDFSFSSEKRPRALAWQLGVDARRVRGDGAWSLRAEYARVYRYTYSSYHGQHFEFAGYPTGFPLGPDVDQLSARLERQAGPDWRFGAEGAYTRKGESGIGDAYIPGRPFETRMILSGVVDADARAALTADWSPAPGLALGLTGGFAQVKDLDHVSGRDETGPYGLTRCTVRW